ncbi:caspase recruitment domain-containing protein 19 isoform X3 [Oryzias melastigma]|uniref:caspase recruitment domain-containing protein 19 isoform X3 n=1 Tax=Oryzias melastigma TaxID=30732 RepID=UPI000CF7C651|nr:caspase recruitment domain-containing protein 19 isoform X3 [Oryzias melastigma]
MLNATMSSSRKMHRSCALIRGWMQSWSTGWCCSSTESTLRYSVTRKPARSLSVPAKEQLHGLLKHLHGKGEESCLEFYQALHIHAEDIYRNLPTRTRQREMADSNWSNSLAPPPESYALNDKGPAFFLSCFSFVAGLAILYYYGEVKTLRGSGAFLQCSAAGFSKNAKDVFIFYTEDGHKKIMKLL